MKPSFDQRFQAYIKAKKKAEIIANILFFILYVLIITPFIIIFDLKKGIISGIIIIAGFFICATAFAQIEQKIIKCLSRFFYSREKNK